MKMKYLQVVVGIIKDKAGMIFIAQRSADSHMANMWEFPGGKIEVGETPEQALSRELQEETGICVENATAYDTAVHADNNLHVTLHFYIVDRWQGTPYGREGQPVRWLTADKLQADEFPPANKPIVARLQAEVIQQTE